MAAGVELIRDMRHVITSFLEGDHVEAATDCPEDLCGRWAWVPLEPRKAVLAVHEVANRLAGCDGRAWGLTTPSSGLGNDSQPV